MPSNVGMFTNVPVAGDPIRSDWPGSISPRAVHTFATIAARDAWASPPDGATCYVTGNGRVYTRISSAWRQTAGIMPKFNVYRATAVAVGSGTETGIGFDAETYDSDNAVTNGVFGCTTALAGLWLFTYMLNFGASATGARNAWITSTRLGWTTSVANTASAAPVLSGSVLMQVAASQNVDVRAYQDSGGSLNIAVNSYFQGIYLSP